MAAPQVKTRGYSLAYVVKQRAFKQGFREALAQKPMAYDRECWHEQWLYEMGRLVGICARREGVSLTTILSDASPSARQTIGRWINDAWPLQQRPA